MYSLWPCYTKPWSLLETFSSGVSMDSSDASRVRGLELLMCWTNMVTEDHLWETSEKFLLNLLIFFFSLYHIIKCWKTLSFHPHAYSNTHWVLQEVLPNQLMTTNTTFGKICDYQTHLKQWETITTHVTCKSSLTSKEKFLVCVYLLAYDFEQGLAI